MSAVCNQGWLKGLDVIGFCIAVNQTQTSAASVASVENINLTVKELETNAAATVVGLDRSFTQKSKNLEFHWCVMV